MQDHAWELGIDWEVQKDFDQRYFLQAGFTRIRGRNGLAAPLGLEVGSKIRFGVFDTTPRDFRRHTTQSIDEVIVEFKGLYDRSRNPNQKDSPVVEGATIRLSASPMGAGFAWHYGKDLPAWTCSPELTVDNLGRYLMKVTVKATATNGDKKIWIVDPEMLVGPTG